MENGKLKGEMRSMKLAHNYPSLALCRAKAAGGRFWERWVEISDFGGGYECTLLNANRY